MESSETADSVRSFAVMVRVQGPDPKGLKMRNHGFHQYHSGRTTLSASGFLLPNDLYDSAHAEELSGIGDRFLVPVLTVASIVEPFLSLRNRESASPDLPEFIPGVEIDIMIEDEMRPEKGSEDADKGATRWQTAQCLKLIDVPMAASALQSLIEASLGSLEHGWEVGWSLASLNSGPQSLKGVTQMQVHPEELRNPNHMAKSTTRIAILGVPLFSKAMKNIAISPSNRKGEFVLAVGSPFGVLSPLHFVNSISVGSIANSYPRGSSNISLLMADIRCLPGTEGGPVFDGNGQLIGILIRPLRQKNSGAEIQLVIPWKAIATACSNLLRVEPRITVNGINEGPSAAFASPSLVEKAVASVCLITVDDGVWASGVLLNDQGLILTNAHLLEPWRFGKRTTDSFIGGEPGGHKWSSTSRGSRKIRVRLDHMNPLVWCDARVIYICKGPLDVALLQLESVPDQLCPIIMDFSKPSVGSKAYVVGHGLFGPRGGFFPSVCSGVVAKVVQAKFPPSYQLSRPEMTQDYFPVMLETTAAVHPGGSGGAVVNLNGHMIGLVTSNARHGGGTVIPHLNFSIPCWALLPIFKFSKDTEDVSLLEILDRPNQHISSVWALMPPMSPKSPNPPGLPHSLLEDGDKKEAKGSRFAKFLAEREELLRKPTQIGNAANPPKKNFRSNL